MKKLTLATLLIFSCATTWAADLDKGFAAYASGDFATALTEFKPLAEQGDTLAQFALGYMYAFGQGVPQDNKEAAKWYMLAAEQGNENAQYNLAMMYDNGEGVIEDDKEAVKWLRLAAEQGNAGAQNNLALMHATGQGVIQDNVYAHMWWNLAAMNKPKATKAF